MQLTAVLPTITPLADALDSIGMRYSITGSIAAIIYGARCNPNDIDIIADIFPNRISLFIAAIAADYHVDGYAVSNAVGQHSSLNILSRNTMEKSTFLSVNLMRLASPLLVGHRAF